MIASDETTLTKNFVEVNSLQSWDWKWSGTRVVAAVMILKAVNNWMKKWVTDNYFEKRLNLNPPYSLLLQEIYVTITSDWCLCDIYVWQKFQRKNILKWVIIWIKFKILWLALKAHSQVWNNFWQLKAP